MSSTNRGSDRQPSDYYVTPVPPILDFLKEFYRDTFFNPSIILDPCAGGDPDNDMSYPVALKQSDDFSHCPNLITMDIRPDSRAKIIKDYLAHECGLAPDLIISNPPFNLAVEFTLKALNDVAPGGMVVFLQRLNWLGSDERKPFWKLNMPWMIYVHSKRFGFSTKRSAELSGKPWKKGRSDSIEYAHFVWRKGYRAQNASLRVI